MAAGVVLNQITPGDSVQIDGDAARRMQDEVNSMVAIPYWVIYMTVAFMILTTALLLWELARRHSQYVHRVSRRFAVIPPQNRVWNTA